MSQSYMHCLNYMIPNATKQGRTFTVCNRMTDDDMDQMRRIGFQILHKEYGTHVSWHQRRCE